MLNTDLIATGLLFICFTIGVRRALAYALTPSMLNTTTALFVLTGAGIANDGVYTEYNPTDREAALHNMLHLIGFYVAFNALTVAIFLIGFHLRKDLAWRRYGWYSLSASLVVCALIIVYVTLPASWQSDQGLIERLIIGATFGWQMLTGYRLLRPQRRAGALERPSASRRVPHLREVARHWPRSPGGRGPHQLCGAHPRATLRRADSAPLVNTLLESHQGVASGRFRRRKVVSE